MKIGVLSDTHDYLDRRILELFQGVDHILHAGDVGMQIIVFELAQIAPTTAVLGNTDLGNPLKFTEIVKFGDLTFLVHHIVNPYAPDEKLAHRLAAVRPDIVVFGHTHKEFNQVIGGVRFSIPATPASQNTAPPAASPFCIAKGKKSGPSFSGWPRTSRQIDFPF